jgi:methionyl-tRNA formyltransferase
MEKRAVLAVLCSDEPHHRYLVAMLQQRFALAAVVIEPEYCKRRRLRLSGRWVDYFFATYHHWRRLLLGLSAYRANYFALNPAKQLPNNISTLTVDSINHRSVIDLLVRLRPDLTIVIGTSILRRETLRAARVAVNIHGGYLPYFRGNHCFFFALYESAFDRLGSTIHFVDEGIDTGDIIEHVVPAIYRDDNAETLYCRAEKMAIHRLVELLAEFEQGSTWPRHVQPLGGRLFRTRDRTLYHDIALWLRRVMGRLKLPGEPIIPKQRED